MARNATSYEVAATAYRRGEDPKVCGADVESRAVEGIDLARDLILSTAAHALRLWDDYNDEPADCLVVEVRPVVLAGEGNGDA